MTRPPHYPPPIDGGDAAGVAGEHAGETPRERCLRTGDEQGLRLALVRLAQDVVGLGGAPEQLAAYLDTIAPNADDRADVATCRALASMSGCALTVRGLWHRAGCTHPILAARYRIGRAVSDVVQVGADARALRSPTTPPEPGDVVIVQGPEHVLTVTSRVDLAITTVHSIDGGQRDQLGRQVILDRARRWQVRSDGHAYLDTRRVIYVIDGVRAVLGRA